MKEDKLKKIVAHNEYKKDEIAHACFMFYRNIGRSTPVIIPDIQTVAEMLLAGRGYKLLHIPLKNDEIGAF